MVRALERGAGIAQVELKTSQPSTRTMSSSARSRPRHTKVMRRRRERYSVLRSN
jgi:hypothetical protein